MQKVIESVSYTAENFKEEDWGLPFPLSVLFLVYTKNGLHVE